MSNAIVALRQVRRQLEQLSGDNLDESRVELLALVADLGRELTKGHQGMGDTIELLERTLKDRVDGLRFAQAPMTDIELQGQLQQLQERHSRLMSQISPLSEVAVLHLFHRLEFVALNAIKPLRALAVTSEPARIKEQCDQLPDELVALAQLAVNRIALMGGQKRKKLAAAQESEIRQRWLSSELNINQFNITEADRLGVEPGVVKAVTRKWPDGPRARKKHLTHKEKLCVYREWLKNPPPRKGKGGWDEKVGAMFGISAKAIESHRRKFEQGEKYLD